MKEFVVLHVEDDNDYHFLLTQYFDESFSLLWGVNRKQTLAHLEERKIDAIVFDGEIKGWDDHLEEVLAITKDKPFIILTGSDHYKISQLKKRGYLAHQKCPEGMRAVVSYIKSLAEKKM